MTRSPQNATGPRELAAAVDRIRSAIDLQPTVAIILGSGLGGVGDQIDASSIIPYASIPGFGVSSAGGHRGDLIIGNLESTVVVAMSGRLHRYEGWTNDEAAFPVRVMSALGANRLIVSNAAGGVSPKLCVGDIVVIRDHINLMGGRPGSFGTGRFPSLTRHGDVYDAEMSQIARRASIEAGFNAHEGTYLATLGPNYETRSEYRMMRRIGADVAGMSTVPEVLAAIDVKMRVLGLSLVSNVAQPDVAMSANHEEVLAAGNAAGVKMEAIVRGVLRSL